MSEVNLMCENCGRLEGEPFDVGDHCPVCVDVVMVEYEVISKAELATLREKLDGARRVVVKKTPLNNDMAFNLWKELGYEGGVPYNYAVSIWRAAQEFHTQQVLACLEGATE